MPPIPTTDGPPPTRFDAFVLDVRERRLSRDGVEVQLTPKAFDLLALLVERAGRLVRKEELLEALWPDVVVSEANLTQTVFVLRRALGETESRRFVETVPRAGYRFVAPIESGAPPTAPPAPAGAPPAAIESAVRAPPAAAGRFVPLLYALGALVSIYALYALWPATSRAPSLGPPRPGEPSRVGELRDFRAAVAALERGDAWRADGELARIVSSPDEAPLLRVARLNARLNLGDETGARRLEQEYRWAEAGGTLPERERLWLEATRARARGDSAAGVAPLERLFALEPRAVQVGARLAGALVRADRTPEAELVVARLRQLAPPATDDPQIDLVDAQVAYHLGDPQRSLAAARGAAGKLAAPDAPALLVARAGLLEGFALMELGRLDDADAAFARSAEVAAAAGIRGESARAWRSRALLADRRGRFDEATRAFESALAELVASGDTVNAALTRGDLGGVRISRGRFAEAVEVYQEALRDETVRGSARRRAPMVANSGWAMLELGRLAEATRLFEELQVLARQDGHPESLAYAQLGLAEVAIESGDAAAAARSLDAAARAAVEFGAKELLGYVEAARARSHLAAGDGAAAVVAVERAGEISRQLEVGGLAAQAAEIEAAVARFAGRCDEAVRAAREMADEAGGDGFRVERAAAFTEAADCDLARGRADLAAALIERARSEVDATDSLRARLRFERVVCRARLASAGAAAAAGCAGELVARARDAGFATLEQRARTTLAPALSGAPPPAVEAGDADPGQG